MEKTMARAIYKKMEIGKEYTTYDLKRLIGDDYYEYIPVELQGKDVRKIIASEMWNVVNAGYAKTFIRNTEYCNARGLRRGVKPNPNRFTTCPTRYWTRVK